MTDIKSNFSNNKKTINGIFPKLTTNSIMRLGDYCDFIINPGMQKLPTYLKDTKHALQLIEDKNEKGVPKTSNVLVADIEQMFH